MRTFFIASAIFLVVTPALADTYQDLQTHTNGFDAVLEQDIRDQPADDAELKLQSGDGFFPDDGSGSGTIRKGDDLSASPYVVFRIDGVPYVLKDVPNTSWFAPYVRDAADRGIVSGYRDTNGIPTGIFGPERPVSIQELAKMATTAADINLDECWQAPLNAAAQKLWSAAYIRCAELHNFAVYADGTVDIFRPATRAEVVMTVLQAFGVSLRESPPGNMTLKDVTASTLFSSAIYTALDGGIVAGFSDASGNPTGYFGPEKPVNRAEMSKIISLAVQMYGE